MLGSAPASSKNLTMSVKPSSTASIKMDGPEELIKFTSAPAYIIEHTKFRQPYRELSYVVMTTNSTEIERLLS